MNFSEYQNFSLIYIYFINTQSLFFLDNYIFEYINFDRKSEI